MTDHDWHRAAVNKAWAKWQEGQAAVNKAWAKWQEGQAARSPLWRRAGRAVLAGVAGGVFAFAVLYHIAN